MRLRSSINISVSEALPETPKFSALVFPETDKKTSGKPPVSVQKAQDISDCSSAEPYPALRQKPIYDYWHINLSLNP